MLPSLPKAFPELVKYKKPKGDHWQCHAFLKDPPPPRYLAAPPKLRPVYCWLLGSVSWRLFSALFTHITVPNFSWNRLKGKGPLEGRAPLRRRASFSQPVQVSDSFKSFSDSLGPVSSGLGMHGTSGPSYNPLIFFIAFRQVVFLLKSSIVINSYVCLHLFSFHRFSHVSILGNFHQHSFEWAET